jgi:hypothetical protein
MANSGKDHRDTPPTDAQESGGPPPRPNRADLKGPSGQSPSQESSPAAQNGSQPGNSSKKSANRTADEPREKRPKGTEETTEKERPASESSPNKKPENKGITDREALSYRRLAWSRAVPTVHGQWCIRYVFENGSYKWWTVAVSEDEDSLSVLGPWVSGSNQPVPVEEYPRTNRDGHSEWAGPITEPWEKSGIDLRHCDGCGRPYNFNRPMLIRSRLTCCRDCWDEVPKGFREAFVQSETPEDGPSPVEAGIRRFLKAISTKSSAYKNT